MKKPIVIFLHLGYWLFFLLLAGLFMSVITLQSRKTGLPMTAVWPLTTIVLVPNLFAFYSSYFYLAPLFPGARKVVLTALSGALICLVSTLIALALAVYFFGFEQPVLSDAIEFFALSFSFSFIAALHCGTALVIRGFIGWFEEIKLKQELAQKNHEIEIALLKSQINPHFLFNTLNNIDVLITKDAVKASECLNRLSDLLRYLVYETKAEKISLADEIGHIEKYLELQKIRTAHPDYLSFFVKGETKNLRIAPVCFFPFIENAFKHTENNKKSNTIKLEIEIVEKTIRFACRNTYQKDSARRPDYGGLGNELIRRRLELLYPGKHRLEIRDFAGVYDVSLTIYED